MSWTNADFLPADPLLAVVPKWEQHGSHVGDAGKWQSMGGVKAVLPENLARAVFRIRKSGRVTYTMADEIACALGYHPAELYGEAWWSET